MGSYRVLAWRGIPTQIRATDETGARADRAMPRWFMQEISRITMREGLEGTDAYLDEFAWTADVERPGTADEIADAVMAELAEQWGRTVDGRRIHGAREAGDEEGAELA
jgi:hypothetical protein